MKKYILIAVLIITNTVFAGNPVDNFRNNKLLENANISLLVKDLKSGRVVSEFRSKNSVIPASTMKLVTTASALEILGVNFRFETKIEIDGKVGSDSILNGNLYIHGGGDPTLGSEKTGDADFLSKWVKALKNAGIKNIKGQIIVDESIFDDEGVNPRWTWEDIGNYYAPGIYGLSYLDNTCKVVLRSGKVGSTPEILKTIPSIPEFSFINQLKSTTISIDSAYFYGAPHSYQRSIYGEIPANRNEFIVKSDIPNPGLLLAKDLQQKLLKNGFTVSKSPTDKFNPTVKRKLIFTHYSPALSKIITETNIKSNNHYAEYLFRYLGLKYSVVGTTNSSLQVIKDFWKSKGLPVDQLFMYDGSGLSPSNAVSAHFYIELLTYMSSKSNNKAIFKNSLPISGVSGTLSSFLRNTPLQGKVRAKSGSISRVRCYAGYIDTNTKNYAFVLMVNNANGSSKAVAQKMEEFLLTIAK